MSVKTPGINTSIIQRPASPDKRKLWFPYLKNQVLCSQMQIYSLCWLRPVPLVDLTLLWWMNFCNQNHILQTFLKAHFKKNEDLVKQIVIIYVSGKCILCHQPFPCFLSFFFFFIEQDLPRCLHRYLSEEAILPLLTLPGFFPSIIYKYLSEGFLCKILTELQKPVFLISQHLFTF